MARLKSLMLLSSLLISGCGGNNIISHNYHETRDSLISWKDIFIQEEDYYLVYFYSERCGHCNEIKNEMISFYLSEIVPMYFVCTDIEAIFGNPVSLNGIDNINDFYIFGTPFLIEMKDHVVDDYYLGSNEILEYISILNKK